MEQKPLNLKKLVMLSAKIRCIHHPTQGVFMVTSNMVRLQKTTHGNEADNTKLNFLFPGICMHPSNYTTAIPCIGLIVPGQWEDVGSIKIQTKKALLKKSKIFCYISQKHITIIHDGQTSMPSLPIITLPDVPILGEKKSSKLNENLTLPEKLRKKRRIRQKHLLKSS